MVLLSHQAEISADVLSQEISGETVLLNMNGEAYYGLDATGTRIWQLIRENGRLQTVFDAMLAEYGVEEDVLRKDLIDLLNELAAVGLIVLKPAD